MASSDDSTTAAKRSAIFCARRRSAISDCRSAVRSFTRCSNSAFSVLSCDCARALMPISRIMTSKASIHNPTSRKTPTMAMMSPISLSRRLLLECANAHNRVSSAYMSPVLALTASMSPSNSGRRCRTHRRDSSQRLAMMLFQRDSNAVRTRGSSTSNRRC